MSRMLSALRSLEAKAESFEPHGATMVIDAEPEAAPIAEPPPSEQADPPIAEPPPEQPGAASFDAFASLLAPPKAEPFSTPPAEVAVEEASPSQESPEDAIPAAAAPEAVIADGPLTAVIERSLADAQTAAQFREAAAAVMRQFPGPASLLVIGADAGEHAAQVAGALGALLAREAGREVLLVDANLTAREVSRGFGCEQHRGLCEALLEDSQDDAESCATALEGLRILPAGRETLVTAADNTRQIAAFLARQTAGDRFTLIHGGAADAALTRQFAAACDGVYLVLRLGQTHAADAQETLAALKSAGANVRGCIATNAA